jgi:hypothetical protein
MHAFANVDEIAKHYTPEGFVWGEKSFITGAKEQIPVMDVDGKQKTDADGKPVYKYKDIPRTFSDWKVTNDDGTDATPQFKNAVENTFNDMKANGDTWGTKTDEELKTKIANLISDKSSKKETETLSREAHTNNIFNMGVEPQTPFNTAGNLVSKGVSELSNSRNVFQGLQNQSVTFQTKQGPKKVTFGQMFDNFSADKTPGYQHGVQSADFKMDKENLSPEKVNSYEFKQAILSNSFDKDGNPVSDSDDLMFDTDPKTNNGKPTIDQSKLSLSNVSLVFGTDEDPDHGHQPTKFAKDNMTGKEMNDDGYAPYYRFTYKLIDKKGTPHTFYHYGSTNNQDKTRGYDAVLLTEGVARDVEDIKGK